MQKKIVFRADASLEIGTGHVMRCAALGEALCERGAEVVFLCRQLPDGYREKLAEAGINVSLLGNKFPFDARADAEQTILALQNRDRPDWLIVDHYGLDAQWEGQVRPHVSRIMVIDDLANRHHDCDLLLDQNYYTNGNDRYRGFLSIECHTLLGPHYALLRSQFSAAYKNRRWRDGIFHRLLICFGGADADNLTARGIEAFLAADLESATTDVAIGGANIHWRDLNTRYGMLPNIQLHHDVNDMAQLMEKADLFLGAGGSITWERSAVALPGLTIAVAENQEHLCANIETLGGGMHLGDGATTGVSTITSALQLLKRHPRLLRAFGERLALLSDGCGAGRVARILVPPIIKLRQARQDDCEHLYAWRNDTETRRYSGDGKPIAIEAHRAWFASTLTLTDRILLIGEQLVENGSLDPIGVVRYDLDDAQATISIYLVPGREGSGLGAALIEAADSWLSKHLPTIVRVQARVNVDNLVSLGAFHAAHYAIETNLLIKILRRSDQIFPEKLSP